MALPFVDGDRTKTAIPLLIDEGDVVKMILDFLCSKGLFATLIMLEKESGISSFRGSDDARFLRQLVYNGLWDDVTTFLNPLFHITDFPKDLCLFIVLRGKYLEMLCFKAFSAGPEYSDNANSRPPSCEEMVHCLKELQRVSPSSAEYNQLAFLLSLPSICESPQYSGCSLYSIRVSVYQELMEIVDPYISPSSNRQQRQKSPTLSKSRSKSFTSGNLLDSRLKGLLVKGLLYESAVEMCTRRAMSSSTGSLEVSAFGKRSLLAGSDVGEADAGLVCWLESLPFEAFMVPFEQRALEVTFSSSVELMQRRKKHHHQQQLPQQQQVSIFDYLMRNDGEKLSGQYSAELSNLLAQAGVCSPSIRASDSNAVHTSTSPAPQKKKHFLQQPAPTSGQSLSLITAYTNLKTRTNNDIDLDGDNNGGRSSKNGHYVGGVASATISGLSTSPRPLTPLRQPPVSSLVPKTEHPSVLAPVISDSEHLVATETTTDKRTFLGADLPDIANAIPSFVRVSILEDSHPVRAVAVQPSGGRFYAVGSNSRTLRICRYPDLQIDKIPGATTEPLGVIPLAKQVLQIQKYHRGSIFCLSWNLTGELLASGSNDKTVKVFRFDSVQECPVGAEIEIENIHDGTVRDICFLGSGNQNLLASGGQDCRICLTDIGRGAAGEMVTTLTGHSDHIFALAPGRAMPNTLLSASRDKTVRLWDVSSKSVALSFETPEPAISLDTAAGELTNTIAVGLLDGSIELYDVRKAGSAIAHWQAHFGELRCLQFRPASNHTLLLLSASYDCSVGITVANSPPFLTKQVAHHSDKIVRCCWNLNREKPLSFLSASADKTVCCWMATRSPLPSLS